MIWYSILYGFYGLLYTLYSSKSTLHFITWYVLLSSTTPLYGLLPCKRKVPLPLFIQTENYCMRHNDDVPGVSSMREKQKIYETPSIMMPEKSFPKDNVCLQ